MRNLIFLISILFYGIGSFSQQVTIISESLENDQLMRHVIELENGTFVTLHHSGPNVIGYYEALQKLETSITLRDCNMEVLNSNRIFDYNDPTRILAEGVLLLDEEILLYGNALDTVSMDTKLCMVWLDYDLSIVQVKYYGLDDEEEMFLSYCVDDDGNFVFAGKYPIWSQNQKLVFIEVDSNGVEVRSNHTDQTTSTPNIVFLDKDQSYQVCYHTTVLKFDKDFSLLSMVTPTLFNNFFPWGQPVKLNDSSYFRTGIVNSNVYPYKADISRVIFNERNEFYDLNQIVVPDEIDSPADKVAICFVELFPYYFLGGSISSDGGSFLEKDTPFALQKFDLEGNIYWEEIYETGGNAEMMQVLALQDGGCLMAGQIYDWRNSPTQQRDLFFIKVDDAGIVTGTEEEVPEAEQLRVYPNPGSSHMNISFRGEIQSFSMYDKLGRIVLEESWPGNSIQTYSLPDAFYFWLAKLQNGKTITGKWIKE